MDKTWKIESINPVFQTASSTLLPPVYITVTPAPSDAHIALPVSVFRP